jgi:ribosomal protein L37AE/L43A
MLAKDCGRQQRAYPTASLSNSLTSKKAEGRHTMARMNLGYLPQENPCAQCGKPIAVPDWIEAGPRRVSYLWQCRACDYRFEAVAFFDDSRSDPEAIAA